MNSARKRRVCRRENTAFVPADHPKVTGLVVVQQIQSVRRILRGGLLPSSNHLDYDFPKMRPLFHGCESLASLGEGKDFIHHGP
jgi:hypothetical protein